MVHSGQFRPNSRWSISVHDTGAQLRLPTCFQKVKNHSECVENQNSLCKSKLKFTVQTQSWPVHFMKLKNKLFFTILLKMLSRSNLLPKSPTFSPVHSPGAFGVLIVTVLKVINDSNHWYSSILSREYYAKS